MTVSRVSFDATKNYLEVQFDEDVALLDSELNETQKIRRFFESNSNQKLYGAAVQGDDWLVFPSTTANSIMVKAGTFFFKGYQFILYQDAKIGGLTTPGSNRTDTVYVKYQEALVTSGADPDIIDPALGSETTQRVQLSFQILVAEGATTPPTPSPGWGYFQIGTLSRLSGNASVTSGMIGDDRHKQVHTYVMNGLQVVRGTGGAFHVAVNPGAARVADQDIYLTSSPSEFVLSASTISYLIMRTAETVEVVTTLPTTFQVILARVVTNSDGVVVAQSQNGTTVAGSGSVSGLTDTSGCGLGQYVLGAGIPVGASISVINNVHTVHILPVANSAVSGLVAFLDGITDERSFQPLVYMTNDVTVDGSGISTYVAGVHVPKFSLVYPTTTSDVVLLADNTSSATAPVIAIAVTDVALNEEGTFLKQGQVTNPSWTWTLGLPIFLGTSGSMTQTAPSTPLTIIQEVARPITAHTIEFNPKGTVRN